MSQAVFGFSAYIADRAHSFTGHELGFGEIDRRLADPGGSRHFIIPKELGIGKTAIAAQLTQFHDPRGGRVIR